MIDFKNCFLIFLFSYNYFYSQETKIFNSINEVLNFAKEKNYSFKNAQYQEELAEITKKTSIWNIFTPRIPLSAQAINNLKQQVSFLPGQIFGLQDGTYKEVTMGQQYVSTFSIQPQFDIINMSNIAQIKTANLNLQLVENQNKINEKSLYENINSVYYNILSFQAQKEIVIENIHIAESILKIISTKFLEGIARKQEVNEAEINLINLKDKLQQIELNLKNQYNLLNLFFENSIKSEILESIWAFDINENNNLLIIENDLKNKNVTLQRQIAEQDYKSILYQNIPVLSFVSSLNWQNSSNEYFFSSSSNWLNFNYIGLKLTYDFPTTIQKYSNLETKKIQIETLKNNELHVSNENKLINDQMILEYEKAIAQKINLEKIYILKKDTYEKNYNQFIENILSLDKLLISQNDMIISKLNLVLNIASIGFSKTKIDINNNIK